jgi:hypothetical protein
MKLSLDVVVVIGLGSSLDLGVAERFRIDSGGTGNNCADPSSRRDVLERETMGVSMSVMLIRSWFAVPAGVEVIVFGSLLMMTGPGAVPLFKVALGLESISIERSTRLDGFEELSVPFAFGLESNKSSLRVDSWTNPLPAMPFGLRRVVDFSSRVVEGARVGFGGGRVVTAFTPLEVDCGIVPGLAPTYDSAGISGAGVD